MTLALRRQLLRRSASPGRPAAAPARLPTISDFSQLGSRYPKFLRERLGDGFVGVELDPADRHPNGPLRKAHSVLTGDLIDEPGQPTRAALDQVLALLRSKLLS